ncbi:hypothetical protein IAT38_004549 [Cryptococcus sp. DSM 104549]
MTLQPQITTHHTTLPPPFPAAPAFLFHLTRMADTLFIWAGTASPSEASGASGDSGQGSGAGGRGKNDELGVKKLAGDWAVAMPSRGNIAVTATPIFRTGATDIALPMSQRLARRFNGNQIHLSLSLPASLTNQSGPSMDPYASKALLAMEKKLGTWLGEVLAEGKGQ